MARSPISNNRPNKNSNTIETMKITSPLIVLDLETSDVTQDAGIIEIATLKIYPDGRSQQKEWVLNPEKPINPKATEVHGYSDEMVKDKPTFKEVAIQVYNEFSDAETVMTYNGNSFDIPILYRHFASVGIEWNPNKLTKLDVFDIIRRVEPRTLEAMFKKYVGEELKDAHSASADTAATLRLFFSLAQRHPDMGESPAEVAKWAQNGKEEDYLDIGQVFKYDSDRNITFAKGKHAGEIVDLSKHKSYLEWQLNASNPPFLPDAKQIISKLLNNQNK